MDLLSLVRDEVDLTRLAKDLDELGQPGRLWAIKSWNGRAQARIFEAAKGFRPLSLEHFVPSGSGPLTEVIHHGRNTLPAHNDFQKRFCLPKDEATQAKLWGYNHQSWSGITGPGYF